MPTKWQQGLIWSPLVPFYLQTQPDQRPPMLLTPPPGHVPQPKTARTTNQDLWCIICVSSPWYFLLFSSFLFAILIIYQITCTGTTTTNGTTTTQGVRVRDGRGGWQRDGLETWHVSGPLVFFFLYAQIPIYLYSTFFYYFGQLKWFFEPFDWLILAMEHLVLLFLHLPVFFWSHFPFWILSASALCSFWLF